MNQPAVLRRVRTSVLDIAYEESGPADGIAVLLMHGFPYDPRTYDEVVPSLVEAGCRAIVPYLRGYGATRFLASDTPRSGQQAALGNDLKELVDALAVERAVLAGYDWGGRAACIVAAVWPERVLGLVSANGYNIQDIAGSVKPASAEQEYRLWYQYYFHTERGRAGLQANRREFCRLLWRLWSPNWRFDDIAHFAQQKGPFRGLLLPDCYHSVAEAKPQARGDHHPNPEDKYRDVPHLPPDAAQFGLDVLQRREDRVLITHDGLTSLQRPRP